MKVEIDGKEFVEKYDSNLGNRNSGNRNSGNRNSGYMNSGDRNSGDCNSGNSNSGNSNSGNRNSGDMNSGYMNSGDRNSGDMNSGDRNSGDMNSGYMNSGDMNSGYMNSGYMNSGYMNSGDRNSGNWNSGDRNSGYLNTDEPFIRIFGKETQFKFSDINKNIIFPEYFCFNLTEFVDVSEMTEEEKKSYPHYSVTNGFLRVWDYKEAWKISFEKTTKKDVALTLNIPNFDYMMFEKISGITKEMIDKKMEGE